MRTRITLALGKIVRRAALLRGGGSALPGLVAEKVDPGFMARILAQLPHGVVVVSGTNGKTTTTKMVTELLEAQGLRVFTNRTGSNFTRGVVAALLAEVPLRSGRLDADVAVLELDEAHAVHFVKAVAPRHCLLLNVLRDQLDRFGELDTTARLLASIVERTTTTVVLNREDGPVSRLADRAQPGAEVRWFGLNPALHALFPSDDDLHANGSTALAGTDDAAPVPPAEVTLEAAGDHAATFGADGRTFATDLQVNGAYNQFNAAAALTLARAILADAGRAVDMTALVAALAHVTPAFGRGERVVVGHTPVDLVLVKNPSGFRLALASFDAAAARTMIAINDQDADGRDMSWLWDVDFSSLAARGVERVTGIRADDMALRLDHDLVPVGEVTPDIPTALAAFLDDGESAPRRIYTTYTAMLELRRLLGERADLTDVWTAS